MTKLQQFILVVSFVLILLVGIYAGYRSNFKMCIDSAVCE